MPSAINKNIKRVWLRCSVNLLLAKFAWVLLIAGLLALLIVAAQRAFAVTLIFTLTIYIFAGLIVLVSLLLWIFSLPTRLQTALLIDKRLALKERFSTATALAASKDPFALAARAEAEKLAKSLACKKHFLIRPSRHWLYVIIFWAATVALFIYMPAMDLFGRESQHLAQQQQQEQMDQAQDEIRQVTTAVRTLVSQLPDSEALADLGALDQPTEPATPEQIRRQAIRKLGDLAEKISRDAESLASVEAMKEMFKHLRSGTNVFSRQFHQALASGDVGKAADIVRKMQEQLTQGDLSEQQTQALAQQLAEIGKQLDRLAQENASFAEKLAQAGLDPALANLNSDDLRKALEKLNLTPEQIEQLLQQAAACQSANASCSALAQAMAACGASMEGLSAEDLAELLDQLAELAALSDQFDLAQACLGEINQAICMLGQGDCAGSNQPGRGIGTSPGPYSISESIDSELKSTRVAGKSSDGPAIASWYFKGPQVKTEAKREFADIIQASRDSAAEAISENQIPRKYEESIKRYFGQLEESAQD